MRDAAAALLAGEPVILPTDTVYGLCAAAGRPEAAARLAALKGRDPSKPSALLFASIEQLIAWLPGLSDTALRAVEALLPGPYTLVVEHTGSPVGVRVP